MNANRRPLPNYPVVLAIATFALAGSARAQLCLDATEQAYLSVLNTRNAVTEPDRKASEQTPASASLVLNTGQTATVALPKPSGYSKQSTLLESWSAASAATALDRSAGATRLMALARRDPVQPDSAEESPFSE